MSAQASLLELKYVLENVRHEQLPSSQAIVVKQLQQLLQKNQQVEQWLAKERQQQATLKFSLLMYSSSVAPGTALLACSIRKKCNSLSRPMSTHVIHVHRTHMQCSSV